MPVPGMQNRPERRSMPNIKCTCGANKFVCIDCMQDAIDKYEELLFKMGAMNHPPCFRCGYNGKGYYQPETHPCVKYHHEYFKDELK